METETKIRRPRGRPPVLDWVGLTQVGRRWPGASHRTRINLHYASEALAALDIDGYDESHPLKWLHYSRNGKMYFKTGILTELGRLLASHGLETMAEAAKEICKVKPTVKDGMATLRQLRLGRQPGASADGLADALWKTFCTYRAAHGEFSEVEAIHAVQALADHVAEMYGLSTEPVKD